MYEQNGSGQVIAIWKGNGLGTVATKVLDVATGPVVPSDVVGRHGVPDQRAGGPRVPSTSYVALQPSTGQNPATVYVARKLVIIAWHLLSRGENYAFMRPALYRLKLRKLELMAGGPGQRGKKLPEPAFLKPSDRRRRAEVEWSSPWGL